MFFARNEEDGMRCVYHGWKFDVSGQCVDLPNAPEGETFKHKVRITAYPCVEAGDLVWAYMGPAERKPPFPEFEWTKLGAEHRYINKFRLECNYLQAMEGDYDPSHGNFLHSTMDDVSIPNPLLPSGRGISNAPTTPQLNIFNPDANADDPFPRAVGPKRRVNATCRSGVQCTPRKSRMLYRCHAASISANVASPTSRARSTPITSAPNVGCSGRNWSVTSLPCNNGENPGQRWVSHATLDESRRRARETHL